jgi:ankyrin repeat protein
MKHRNLIYAFVIVIFLIVSGCALSVQKLIDEGTINKPDSSGYTPLMRAAWSGKTETVRVLIDNGADINARDKDGHTPLLWAVNHGHLDIVKILIDKGADVNAIANDRSTTPYSLAVQTNNTELAKLLKDKGADENKSSKELLAMKSREFESNKKVVFASVLSVMQDLSYIINSADIETGFITAKSATTTTRRPSGSIMNFTTATVVIEELRAGTITVRLNFLETYEYTFYKNRYDYPVEDPVVYQNAFTKIQESIFRRRRN